MGLSTHATCSSIIISMSIYPTLTKKDRPMMLGFDGQFLDPTPTLAAIVKPWANILYAKCNNPIVKTGFHPVRDKKDEKNPSLVLTYGSVESPRFLHRKKTVGMNFRILSERIQKRAPPWPSRTPGPTAWLWCKSPPHPR
jgi:hypothetical protein